MINKLISIILIKYSTRSVCISTVNLFLFFPNKSATIKSYILLKVKFREDSIILAMGSKDKNKFKVDMQTDLVEYLIKIIEINLLNIK